MGLVSVHFFFLVGIGFRRVQTSNEFPCKKMAGSKRPLPGSSLSIVTFFGMVGVVSLRDPELKGLLVTSNDW